ncbi:MAG: PAS domain S-box protein, partial [Desulfobacula sp.]|nr:PAS domain S-box protein [Desulfobacula sp.]
MLDKPTYEELELRVKELERTEKALKKSEEKYRLVVENANEGIAISQDNKYIFVNQRMEEMSGYSREELMELSVSGTVHPDHRQTFIERNQRRLEGKPLKDSYEYKAITNEHKTKWISTKPVQIEWHSAPAILTFISDITERKQAEEALKEGEQFFSQMFEQSIVSTQLLDPEGNTIRVNPKFCELFGVTPEDMKHYKIPEDEAIKKIDAYEPFMDIFNNKNSQRWRNSFDIALASKSSGVKTTKPETIHLENVGYPILDKDGNLQHVVIQHNDITEQVKADQALKESEETYRNIFTNTQVGLFRTNPETGDVLDINDALARMVGFKSREEILDNNLSVSDYYEDGNRRQEIAEKLIKTGSYKNEEALFLNHQKEYKWLRMSGILTGEGIIEGVAEDITEVKKVQDALKESKENFQAIVENTENGVTVTDTDGNLLYSNEKSANNLGLKSSDLNGKSVYDIFPKEFADGMVERIRKVVKSQKVYSHLIEVPIDGDLDSFHTDMIPLRYNGKNAVLTVSTDITDIIKTQKALEKSEEKFRMMVENMAEGVVISEELRPVYVNKRMCDMSGYSTEELIGGDLTKFFSPENLEKVILNVEKVLKGEKVKYDAEGVTKSGKEISVLISGLLLPNGDTIGIFSDITERKRAEEKIKASLKEKQVLLDEVNHRVKNNMQVINSLLKLQSNSIEDNQVKDVFRESQSRIYAMSAVHETLHGSENLSEIDLNSYLSKVTASIFQTYSINPDKVTLNTDIEKIPISINQASPLGLII